MPARAAKPPPPLLPRRPSRRRKRPGSQEVPINLAMVKQAAQAGCTQVEIAAMIGVHPDTLRARIKRDGEVAAAVEDGAALGKAILRIKLYNKGARDGHPQTLQFLARTMLGMREDAPAGTGTGSASFLVETRPKAPDVDAWAEQYAPLRGDQPPKAGG